MQADKTPALRQRFDVAVDEKTLARQFPPPARGVSEQDADAALDVDSIVAPRCAGVEGELIERLFALAEIAAERLQEIGALVESHRPQSGAAHAPRVARHRGEVEPGAGGVRDCAPVDGAGDRDKAGSRGDPAAERKTVEDGRLLRGGDFGHVAPLM